jgi:WD40 repeat protein
LSGNLLAIGNKVGTISIMNLTNGQILRNIIGHSNWIMSLKLLKDGRLASASYDETIKIWNYQSGQLLKTLGHHTDSVRGLAVLSNNRLASGSWDRTIKIWNTTNWDLLNSITYIDEIFTLTLLSDENLAIIFYTTSGTQIMKILNPNTYQVVRTIQSRNTSVHFNSIELLSDGNLASGMTNGEILIYNPINSEILRTLRGHTNAVWSLLALNNMLFSGSKDGEIRFWDFGNGELLGTFNNASNYSITAVAFSSDAGLIITAASCFYNFYCNPLIIGEIKLWS